MSEIILTQIQKDTLNQLCEDYNAADEEAKSFDNKRKALNLFIKQTMADYGVTKFVSDNGISLNVSSRPDVSWDEEALTEYCKTLNKPDLVKQKDYVDFDVLESLLYHGDINPNDLKPFKKEKPDIVTLKCTQKKTLIE